MSASGTAKNIAVTAAVVVGGYYVWKVVLQPLAKAVGLIEDVASGIGDAVTGVGNAVKSIPNALKVFATSWTGGCKWVPRDYWLDMRVAPHSAPAYRLSAAEGTWNEKKVPQYLPFCVATWAAAAYAAYAPLGDSAAARRIVRDAYIDAASDELELAFSKAGRTSAGAQNVYHQASVWIGCTGRPEAEKQFMRNVVNVIITDFYRSHFKVNVVLQGWTHTG